MGKNKIVSLGLAGWFCLAIFLPVVAYGVDNNILNLQGAPDYTAAAAKQAGYSPAGTENPPELIVGRIVRYVMTFLGVVFFVLIVYAGWLWLTASGNEEQITKAKGLIINSIIGLVIVFAAYVISSFVVTKVMESVGNGSTAPTNPSPPAE